MASAVPFKRNVIDVRNVFANKNIGEMISLQSSTLSIYNVMQITYLSIIFRLNPCESADLNTCLFRQGPVFKNV